MNINEWFLKTTHIIHTLYLGLHLKMSKTLVHVNVSYSDSLCSEIRSFSFFFFIRVLSQAYWEMPWD